MESLAFVSFGATIADMHPDFIKVGGVWDTIKNWMQEHPEMTGGIGGGLLGLLAGRARSQQGDPYAGQTTMLAGLLGAGGGALLGHYLPGWMGWGRQPAPVRGTQEPRLPEERPVADRTTLPPVAGPGVAPEPATADVSARDVEPRTTSTEAATRQQSMQEQQQQAQQAGMQREQAGLTQDSGKVQARIQTMMAPQPPAPGMQPRRPITITPGPGVRQIKPGHGVPLKRPGTEGYFGGAKFAAAKVAGVEEAYEAVKEWIKKNPSTAATAGGAVGGGLLGGGLGWATSDPETRKRKMMMGLLAGGLTGGAGGFLGERAARSMGDISAAADALKGAGRSVAGAGEEAEKQIAALGTQGQGLARGLSNAAGVTP